MIDALLAGIPGFIVGWILSGLWSLRSVGKAYERGYELGLKHSDQQQQMAEWAAQVRARIAEVRGETDDCAEADGPPHEHFPSPTPRTP